MQLLGQSPLFVMLCLIQLHFMHLCRGWDQFEVNETLFGVKSTFDEELYTTKLDRGGPQMRDLEREASRLAREIEGEDTLDLHSAEVMTSPIYVMYQFLYSSSAS